jgi:hypothetical protein
VGVFGEVRSKVVVAKEFVQEDGRRVPKALLSVDVGARILIFLL